MVQTVFEFHLMKVFKFVDAWSGECSREWRSAPHTCMPFVAFQPIDKWTSHNPTESSLCSSVKHMHKAGDRKSFSVHEFITSANKTCSLANTSLQLPHWINLSYISLTHNSSHCVKFLVYLTFKAKHILSHFFLGEISILVGSNILHELWMSAFTYKPVNNPSTLPFCTM